MSDAASEPTGSSDTPPRPSSAESSTAAAPAAPSNVVPPRGIPAPQTLDDTPPKRMPSWVFRVELAWLVMLLAIFVVYQTSGGFRSALPNSLGSNIPVGVPWFGALGGCLISLGGIFAYNDNWDESFNYWHALRPILGAITGGIGCLLLLVTNQLSTTGPVHTDVAFYYTVAFVFGYAEAAFRTLITNVTNVILKPGS